MLDDEVEVDVEDGTEVKLRVEVGLGFEVKLVVDFAPQPFKARRITTQADTVKESRFPKIQPNEFVERVIISVELIIGLQLSGYSYSTNGELNRAKRHKVVVAA